MKRFFSTLAVAVLLTGCGSPSENSDVPADATNSTTSPSTSPSPTTSAKDTTSSTSPSPTTSAKDTTSETATGSTTYASPPAPEPQPEAVSTEPIFSSPGVGYQCGGTDAWVYDPANCVAANLGSDPAYDTMYGPGAAQSADQVYQDLSKVPHWEGGTCPAAECGYGVDENGVDLNQEKIASHTWWSECVSVNTAEYCRANDPWQQ